MSRTILQVTIDYYYHLIWMRIMSSLIRWVPDKHFVRVIRKSSYHSLRIAYDLKFMSELSGRTWEIYDRWGKDKIEKLETFKLKKDQG